MSDVGDCLYTALYLAPSDLLAPGYYASMGCAVPAALGVQAATGDRPIVLVGDAADLVRALRRAAAARGCFQLIDVRLARFRRRCRASSMG